MASAATVQPTYPLHGQTNRLTLHMATQLPMSIVLNIGEANVYERARSLILPDVPSPGGMIDQNTESIENSNTPQKQSR